MFHPDATAGSHRTHRNRLPVISRALSGSRGQVCAGGGAHPSWSFRRRPLAVTADRGEKFSCCCCGGSAEDRITSRSVVIEGEGEGERRVDSVCLSLSFPHFSTPARRMRSPFKTDAERRSDSRCCIALLPKEWMGERAQGGFESHSGGSFNKPAWMMHALAPPFCFFKVVPIARNG